MKEAVLTATGAAKPETGRKKKPASEGVTRDLVQAVIRRNPDFQRLDGILTSLAEACLNPTVADRVQVVGVCSAAKGEGKTTVALGLATALAHRGGSQVLLIEGDLASPTLAKDLQKNESPGLVECLLGDETLEAVIQPTPIENLAIITAGQVGEDPISLLTRTDLRQLLETLRSRYRYILLDMPAILEREDAGRLVELVDGVMLVIAAGRVPKEVTESGVAAIGRDKLMGVVLNRAQTTAPRWLNRILSDGESPLP